MDKPVKIGIELCNNPNTKAMFAYYNCVLDKLVHVVYNTGYHERFPHGIADIEAFISPYETIINLTANQYLKSEYHIYSVHKFNILSIQIMEYRPQDILRERLIITDIENKSQNLLNNDIIWYDEKFWVSLTAIMHKGQRNKINHHYLLDFKHLQEVLKEKIELVLNP